MALGVRGEEAADAAPTTADDPETVTVVATWEATLEDAAPPLSVMLNAVPEDAPAGVPEDPAL